MQFPKGRHWNEQQCEVRNTVENSGSFETSARIEAMASSEKLIPNFLSRATLEYLEKCFGQVKEEDCPDTRLYRNKHGRFPRLVDDEDFLILKKNRGLDEANINVVQYTIDV